MEWFYQIPGVDDLRSADAFFQFFAVPYQPERLAHCSLPVLAAFHRKLRAEVPLLNQLEENPRAYWLLARRLLAESYQQQFEENTP
ncbi:nitrogenase-stabilizing/protective protein [Klebsiella quasipneumoniae]|uniref:nitrogenase-stabilizing/protective protein NifW n=1 Tax=Klebsiella quasipneumoniae TaxID=1463165 RepID=UPI0008764192|nr:nitrogenase-stabilizing/protective protein NifW [Klebsiella quasipneumoniae]HCB0360504.1 nitrogen fixation protein NifW [Klebsiella quasipneumoniae subsp. quasipneumoniae]SCW31506.1 nitrogenase-stabilizing/protective protein [Klebsiella quasipneumoniae]SCY53902.1 nitrogenase-stabilizing/protective protein [Klebsiella quasipneumoniae]SCZ50138.1 nitrogenase-stabilizing/protective protein [Klebsiella quasipneumoniae]SDB42770.1 nitrogenase-stabilizing/protective protein [Klebsiella quasipneumon